MTVVDTLEKAMMTGGGDEEQLNHLLGLNERLLAAIATAEGRGSSSADTTMPAQDNGTVVAVQEVHDVQDTQCFKPSMDEQRLRSAIQVAEAEVAETKAKLAQQMGLAPPAPAGEDRVGTADEAAEAPKKAKKKRIRKKKNKADKNTADAADDAETKARAAAAAAAEEAKEADRIRAEAAAAAKAAEKSKQDERDRLARMRVEARRQQAAAREKKQAKKAQKHQKFKAEQEAAGADRIQFWEEERAEAHKRTEMLVNLCVTELVRQNKSKVKGLSHSKVWEVLEQDYRAFSELGAISHKAYYELYKHDSKRRVVVVDEKELNGRRGTIVSFDEAKGKYAVALDTKKGKKDNVQYFKPENLDVATNDDDKNKSGKTKKKGASVKVHNVDHSFGICLPNLLSYDGVSLDLEYFLVSQSDVTKAMWAPTQDGGLAEFAARRDREERLQKQLEEEERAREEEARRRRAEIRAQEEEKRRRRQAEKEREKEELREFLRKQRERMAAGEDDDSDDGMHHRRRYTYYGDSDEEEHDDDDDDDDDDEYEECDCAQCRMRDHFMFMSMFGGRMGGIPAPIFMAMFGGRMGGMPFGMGGIPFGPGMGGFFDEDDDDEGFFGGRFDDAWEEREEQRRQEKIEEQAEILGVPVDADAKTIKTKCKSYIYYTYDFISVPRKFISLNAASFYFLHFHLFRSSSCHPVSSRQVAPGQRARHDEGRSDGGVQEIYQCL